MTAAPSCDLATHGIPCTCGSHPTIATPPTCLPCAGVGMVWVEYLLGWDALSTTCPEIATACPDCAGTGRVA